MNQPLYILDLFSGIGGFSLGFELCNQEAFKTAAFCEIEPFCQKILRKHWSNTPIFNDIKELNYERLQAARIRRIDIITGGFPCQDLSCAGKRQGLQGERSGLFYEIIRLAQETQPRYLLLENSSELIRKEEYREALIEELQKIGYGLCWQLLSACDFGYLHKRERAYVFAWREKAFTHPDKIGRLYFKAIQTGISTQSYTQREWRPSSEIISICLDYDRRITEQDLNKTMRDIRGDDGISQAVERIGSLGNAVVPEIISHLAGAILQTHQKVK